MINIAIVTVTYNAVADICKTVDSVLNQNYEHIQYIVMDGMSTDNTLDKLKEYEEYFEAKHKKYEVICRKDNGIFDAMNSSLEFINAQYVMFLNSGDYLSNENVIGDMASYMENNEKDVYYGDFYIYYKNKRKKIISGKASELPRGMICTHQAIFTRTDLLKEYKYDLVYKLCADYDFYLKMYLLGKTFLHCPITVVYFQDGGISYRNPLEGQKEILRIKNKNLAINKKRIIKGNVDILLYCIRRKMMNIIPECIRYIKYERFEK